MREMIYLDHNAATQVDPKVAQAISDYLNHVYGNPSSIHAFGRGAKKYLTEARDLIASSLKVRPDEIIFTSGGTEGANLVIRGFFQSHPKGHVITSNIEHSCVYNTMKEMEKLGCAVSWLSPGSWGAVTPDAVRNAIRSDTKLIALMAVNNETGVKTDIEEIAAIAQEVKIPFFLDAVALLGKEKFTIPEGVTAMAFSGQKIHATQGVGFCFIRKNIKLNPMITGGGQQFQRRAGTENLPGIVGLAKAVSLLQEELPMATEHMYRLRDLFEKKLHDQLENISINGDGPRVANTSNICFSGVEGETLLAALDLEGLAASHGSACSSGVLEPSRVLINMGYSNDRVLSSLRFSISRYTTEEEILKAVAIITKVVNRLRG